MFTFIYVEQHQLSQGALFYKVKTAELETEPPSADNGIKEESRLNKRLPAASLYGSGSHLVQQSVSI